MSDFERLLDLPVPMEDGSVKEPEKEAAAVISIHREVSINIMPGGSGESEAPDLPHSPKAPITRNAFLYIAPKGESAAFGQCSTCVNWTGPEHETCLGMKGTKVDADDSCGFHMQGDPRPAMAGKELPLFTPEEAGLVGREVRCENCAYFNAEGSHCELFEHLNKQFPQWFKLEEKVEPKACCNAQTPFRDEETEGEEDEDEEKPFTVAVDLDGTLAEAQETHKDDEIAPPRKGAKALLDAIRAGGARIIIFTVRGTVDLVKEWLTEHDMPYDYINENPDQPPDSSGKVIADVYLDDRAISGLDLDTASREIMERLEEHQEPDAS